MGWSGPILTDSGGYQVFSLARLRKISDEAVTFQSHIDGAEVVLTPERSIDVQQLLDGGSHGSKQQVIEPKCEDEKAPQPPSDQIQEVGKKAKQGRDAKEGQA